MITCISFSLKYLYVISLYFIIHKKLLQNHNVIDYPKLNILYLEACMQEFKVTHAKEENLGNC